MDILVNLLPATGRKWLYAILAFAAAVYAIYEATKGNWTEFTASLVTSMVGALAHANVTPTGSEAQAAVPPEG